MIIHLVSSNQDIQDLFDHAFPEDAVKIHNSKRYKTSLQKVITGDPIYIDRSSFTETSWKNTEKFMQDNYDNLYGIIDPEGVITDPGKLFHNGASDYIGPSLLKNSLDSGRLDVVRAYFYGDEIPEPSQFLTNEGTEVPYSMNWDNVKEGNEYLFGLLLANIQMPQEWKKSNQKHIDTVLEIFHNHLSSLFAPHEGRIWIKNDGGCLLLFPYNGNNCSLIETCFRAILNRIIIMNEVYHYDLPISYSFAFDIGKTQYHPGGDTGKIISDSLNFIYHLGQKYLQPKQFCLTKEAFKHVPEGLEPFFLQEGVFEDRIIYRMLEPAHSSE